jgi:cupin fold WbuC family metalloprotein
MQRFYSKIDPNVLLFAINKRNTITNNRTDLSPESEFLQVSTKNLSKGTTFRPHRHLELDRNINRTQEAWIFLSGRVSAEFYDLDNSLFCTVELTSGDCAVAYRAGHSFTVLEDDTLLYEFKNGPYMGIEKDKEFIR